MRGGLSARVRFLLLPSLPAVSGSDHQGVVLIPPTLQPGTPGQPAPHAGRSLVPLLALPARPIAGTRRWDTLRGHRIAGTLPVTADSLNRPRVLTSVVMVNVLGAAAVGNITSVPKR